jgi:hypothetical protein
MAPILGTYEGATLIRLGRAAAAAAVIVERPEGGSDVWSKLSSTVCCSRAAASRRNWAGGPYLPGVTTTPVVSTDPRLTCRSVKSSC